MRKPYHDVSTRQYIGAIHALNNTLKQLPPAFDASQKIPDSDMMDILASNAPKSHKELMITDQGLDPQIATTDHFMEICECAETKEALRSNNYPLGDINNKEMTLQKTSIQTGRSLRRNIGQLTPTRTNVLLVSVRSMNQIQLMTARTAR